MDASSLLGHEGSIRRCKPCVYLLLHPFYRPLCQCLRSTTPIFARELARWSVDPSSIQEYIDNGRPMNDVLGLTLNQALAQLPEEEGNDSIWPYHM